MRETCSRGARVVLLTIGGVVVTGGLSLQVQGVAQDAASPSPTFTKDIVPILQRSCQGCHRAGGLAPMALTTYSEVRPWARAIKQRTGLREMPPWFIDNRVGIQEFKNDPSLSDAEIATIASWVDNRAGKGNPQDLPPSLTFPEEGAWSLPTPPDLIVTSPAFTVKAVSGDTYPDIGSAPTGLTEKRYIKSFQISEFRPFDHAPSRSPGEERAGDLNYAVVHHVVVSALDPGVDPDQDVASGSEFPRGTFRYVYNLGMNAQSFPDDLGVALNPGSIMTFGGHLHPIGREVQAYVQVGFWFHPKGYQPKYPRGIARAPGSARLTEIDIPAGMDNVRHDSFTAPFPTPARMMNFEPHMHASGKRMCVEALYPTGQREMLNCADYNHNWVKAYVYADDVAPLLPKGTILHLFGWYDNSAGNPRNPDPRNWKGRGERSVDDMFQLSSMFVYLTEEEYQAEVAAREAKAGAQVAQRSAR